MVWDIVIAVVAGLAALWLVVIAALWITKGRFDLTALREALRMLPDLIRLLKRLAADPTLPRGVRIRLWLLLTYLLLPIDLVPDFIPIIGYADDAIIVALALRSVIRHAGPEAVERHWPGAGDGLTAILRLAGASPSATSEEATPEDRTSKRGRILRRR
ncbi:YkvA family protein [Actinoallomurus liliacearum]|uniref:YkvA family protein n=1 Tax=Actinoallomurus liliacearum TaxID=1080073 RepID=A0ABP8TNN3_9ACTN